MKKTTLTAIIIFEISRITCFAQEVETLFGDSVNTRFVWSLDTRTMSVQKNIGTSIGASFGAILQESYIAGAAFSSNVTHSRVNQSFLGLYFQYVENPAKLIHWSGGLMLGSGSVKDYQNPKTGPFDNFGNVFGTGYYFIEPGINVEINASKSVRIVTGIAYRLSSGINSSDSTVILNRPSNSDLSGLMWNLLFRFE